MVVMGQCGGSGGDGVVVMGGKGRCNGLCLYMPAATPKAHPVDPVCMGILTRGAGEV